MRNDNPAARLARLRETLKAMNLDGFIVPHADEHQSEYLPPSAERLAWLTGFTGSAGMAIALADNAALFVDGRYTLQAKNETDAGLFEHRHLVETPPAKWLAGAISKGDRIGYDPWLLTVADVKKFAEACKDADAELVPVTANPIDQIWSDRPAPPLSQVSLHPLAYSGEEASAKIARIQETLKARKADAAILTQADSIAWLLNIRGADIAHNPVSLAYAVVPATGKPDLFIDGRKLSNSVRAALMEIAEPAEPSAFRGTLAELGGKEARVLIDPQAAAAAIADALTAAGGTLIEGSDPVILPRAKKNETEIGGARKAHVRDGAAMVRFLAWLDREGPTGRHDEIGVQEKLREFRADTAQRDGAELVDLSFDTISGAGPNGAIIHYRASAKTARRVAPDMLYLVDSGAQYHDGTTDITRTVAIGMPSAEMRDRFTRVLKGHIAVATAKLPVGGLDSQLDPLARMALWQAGLDFDHGTGHGVGSFLSVHEGPTRVSKLGRSALEPGMIFSNEPGYYKTGAYGIRIENLLLVLPPVRVPNGERDMLTFETLTLAPIDRRLVDVSLLTEDERSWLNAYHAILPARLEHLLEADERAWLAEAIKPV